MTLDELLKILERDRRVTVTAENIDAVRWVIRNHRITLRRRQALTSDSAMKIHGIVNHLIDLPRSAEPEIGDFLYVNYVPPPPRPRKGRKKSN